MFETESKRGNDMATITLDANGGYAPESITVNDGDTLPCPLVTPSRPGYRFVAWCTDPELKHKASPYEPITEDITLYAKWVKYTICPDVADCDGCLDGVTGPTGATGPDGVTGPTDLSQYVHQVNELPSDPEQGHLYFVAGSNEIYYGDELVYSYNPSPAP
jgi:uncharacterized repeat protein (TIGR02543 family)